LNRQFIFQIPDALPGFGCVGIKGQSYSHTKNPVLCLHCIGLQNTYYMSKVLEFTLLLTVDYSITRGQKYFLEKKYLPHYPVISLNINPLFRLNWVIVSLNEKSLNHGSP